MSNVGGHSTASSRPIRPLARAEVDEPAPRRDAVINSTAAAICGSRFHEPPEPVELPAPDEALVSPAA